MKEIKDLTRYTQTGIFIVENVYNDLMKGKIKRKKELINLINDYTDIQILIRACLYERITEDELTQRIKEFILWYLD